MDDERPIIHVEDDPEYRYTMDEACEPRIIVDVHRGSTPREPHWEA